MDLIHKIKNTIIRENLIQKNDKILIGLSGGADSVLLFNVLYQLKDDLDFEIKTCHINQFFKGNIWRKKCSIFFKKSRYETIFHR